MRRQIIGREKETSCPREWSIKCLIFDLQHGFEGAKTPKLGRLEEHKVSNV